MIRRCSLAVLGCLAFGSGLWLGACGLEITALADSGSSSPEAGDASDASPDRSGLDAGVEAAVDVSIDAPPGDPAVRFVGRFDTRIPNRPRVGWPGARIIAQFRGPEVSVRLEDTLGASGGPSRYDVIVDGVPPSFGTHLLTKVGDHEYTLATGLGPGLHTIELYRRTEPNLGVTQFLGFTFPGGALLAPPPAPGRRIEFVADSTIDGYGVEGKGPNCTANELEPSHNARLGVVGLVASDLNADAMVTAYSGKGLVVNSASKDPETMGVIFPRALPDDPQSLWDFSRFVPEVVVVSIGGSDFANVSNYPSIPVFTLKYDELVGTVRSKYPAAHVFLTIYAQIKNVYPPNLNLRDLVRDAMQAVIARRANEEGDTKIYLHEMPESGPVDETGCDYHASPALHRRLATELVKDIRIKTGW